MAPTMCTPFMAALLSIVYEHFSAEGFIRTRFDEILFQLARLKACTKTRELCIRKLLFADDAAIVAHIIQDTTEICKQFKQAANLFGHTINKKKTVTLYQIPPGQISIGPHVETNSRHREKDTGHGDEMPQKTPRHHLQRPHLERRRPKQNSANLWTPRRRPPDHSQTT